MAAIAESKDEKVRRFREEQLQKGFRKSKSGPI
jgi:hypothetical protein